MCGILASIAPEVRQIDLKQGIEKLKHRGPDETTTWISASKKVGMAHTRLHLTGEKTGVHPVHSEDRSITAVVNGEFYDYHHIKKLLKARGHHFNTDTDSEILPHLYESFGLEMFTYLNGEFAFVLWDEKQSLLIAARDRFGIKPLAYKYLENRLMLASEAKALAPHGGRWNQKALQQILTHQYLGPNESIFEDIKQIPPGHFLSYQKGKIILHRYFNPENISSKKTLSEPELKEVILEELCSAVTRRHNSGAAYSLSAGVDSSSLVAIASRQNNAAIPTFTISFEEQDYDEASVVLSNANSIGAQPEIVEVTRDDQFDLLETAVCAAEGVTINGQMVAKYKLNRAIAAAGHKVVISAEGADEAFLGYSHLALDAGLTVDVSPQQQGIMTPDNLTPCYDRPEWLTHWPAFLTAKLQFCEELRYLLEPNFAVSFDPQATLNSTLNSLRVNKDRIAQSAHLWTNTALSTYILRSLGDGTEMPHSIEGRVPYLDHHLFGLAHSIPTNLKLRKKETKSILRKALHSVLPEHIRNRPKHPLLAPPLIDSKITLEKIQDLALSIPAQIFSRKKLEKWIASIDYQNKKQTKRFDPMLHIILSLTYIENHYKLDL